LAFDFTEDETDSRKKAQWISKSEINN
jgi:hypothetical protein